MCDSPREISSLPPIYSVNFVVYTHRSKIYPWNTMEHFCTKQPTQLVLSLNLELSVPLLQCVTSHPRDSLYNCFVVMKWTDSLDLPVVFKRPVSASRFSRDRLHHGVNPPGKKSGYFATSPLREISTSHCAAAEKKPAENHASSEPSTLSAFQWQLWKSQRAPNWAIIRNFRQVNSLSSAFRVLRITRRLVINNQLVYSWLLD